MRSNDDPMLPTKLYWIPVAHMTHKSPSQRVLNGSTYDKTNSAYEIALERKVGQMEKELREANRKVETRERQITILQTEIERLRCQLAHGKEGE